MCRFLFILFLGGVLSCVSQSADERPSIIGSVQENPGATNDKVILGRFLIHGNGEYDKAHVKVTNKTTIKLGNGKDAKDGKFEDIKKGSKLAVWFTGPVAESYPVQATAGKIVILPADEK